MRSASENSARSTQKPGSILARPALCQRGIEGGEMSNIKRIGAGPRMSQAVVRGNAVYTAGQVADKSKGGSVADQTHEILAQIDALLAEAGSAKSNILSATIYLADISTFAEMNSVWDEWVDKANPPARATVEAKLVAPAYKVEIAVIAAL
jgi:enamine deaminase RidA (YjgF/YER057c/UK114 family)